MDNQTSAAIETFKARVRVKEEELNRLKKAVNDMCHAVDLPPAYSDVESSGSITLGSIRSDHFYGQPLSTAIRVYLEMRKASSMGAATVAEIFAVLKSGGFKFETKDDEVAKISVRAVLRKNSSTFHKLPNGEYGLLAWYPNAKPPKDDSDADESSERQTKRSFNSNADKPAEGED